MTRNSKIKLAQFGLGPIGLETLKLAATKPWAHVVGAIDIDPAKIGKDLGEITQTKNLRGRKVYRSLEELLAHAKPDIIFHTAVSKFKEAFGQIEPMARRGISVVSSCEELLFPQLREPKLAARLDRICKASGARVIAGIMARISWITGALAEYELRISAAERASRRGASARSRSRSSCRRPREQTARRFRS